MTVQWVHLSAGETLVASSRGAWIQKPQLGAIALSGAMPDAVPATRDTTRHLLDGAIAAAERAASPVQPPRMTIRRWAWQLVGQWYCAHHSVALLPEVIARYEAQGRRDLAAFVQNKLWEERGHDLLPLADLRALGYDADAVVGAVRPTSDAETLVEYARTCARGEHPVEFLGYVYALERRVLDARGDWIERVQAALPRGVDATSAVRTHATEFDHAHVAEAVSFFNGLGGADRTQIVFGCYRTTQVSCAGLAARQPSEGELAEWLAPYKYARPFRTAGGHLA